MGSFITKKTQKSNSISQNSNFQHFEKLKRLYNYWNKHPILIVALSKIGRNIFATQYCNKIQISTK